MSDQADLRKPRSAFRRLVRDLAVEAQEALYHDIGPEMPEYWSGVATLEKRFSAILRGKVKPNV